MQTERCSIGKENGSLMADKNYLQPVMSKAQVNAMSSLALAHVGDAVFELLVRLYLAEKGNETSAGLHNASVAMVNAGAQSRDVRQILPALTEEELAVFHRGRNTRVNSTPRHAKTGEYHEATGLEALMGYLYLMGRTERVSTLFRMILEGCYAD